MKHEPIIELVISITSILARTVRLEHSEPDTIAATLTRSLPVLIARYAELSSADTSILLKHIDAKDYTEARNIWHSVQTAPIVKAKPLAPIERRTSEAVPFYQQRPSPISDLTHEARRRRLKGTS